MHQFSIIKIVICFFTTLLISACSSLPREYQRIETFVLSDTANTQLGKLSHQYMSGVQDTSAYYPLNNGYDAFLSRIAIIEMAERTIDVQYYLFENDLIGQVMLDRLLAAADRGVRIRLLVDDLSISKDDRFIALANNHENMEIRLFNPVVSRGPLRFMQLIGDFSRINRRMHNKALIVDNKIAVTGGRNIGETYYKASATEFIDLDIMQIGKSIPAISRVFDQYWNSPVSFPAEVIINRTIKHDDFVEFRKALQTSYHTEKAKHYREGLKSAPLIRNLKNGSMQWLYGNSKVHSDAPIKVWKPVTEVSIHLTEDIIPFIESAKSELIVFSPYFIPGKEGLSLFRRLREKGVEITVVTNSLASTDVSAVHAGYKRYRKDLLRAGIRLLEVKPTAFDSSKSFTGSKASSLHAKTYIVDRKAMFVGSFNFDPRSARLNTEFGIIYHSAPLVKTAISYLENLTYDYFWELKLIDNDILWFDSLEGIEHNEPVATKDPEAGFFTRIGVAILSVLPIERYL